MSCRVDKRDVIDAVSLRDPSETRPVRVLLVVLLAVLALVAAIVAGWGWSLPNDASDQSLGPQALAIFLGMPGAILGLIATGFAMPSQWRRSPAAGPLLMGLSGLAALGAAAGYLAGALPTNPSGAAWLFQPAFYGIPGIGLLVAAPLTYVARRRRTVEQQGMLRSGQRAVGQVAEVSQTSMVNNVPRWRIVVRFTDPWGATRWVTKHQTTWDPPAPNQQAVVYFNPARPDDQRHMVVQW